MAKKKARKKAAKKVRKQRFDLTSLLEELSDAQRELSRMRKQLLTVQCLSRRVYVSKG